VVIAVLSGMLTYTLQAGPAPVSAELSESGQFADEDAAAPQKTTPLISAQVGLIDELVESLQVAHEELNSSKLRLDKREKNLQELYATYLKLRQEVNMLIDDLDNRLVKVEEGELKNFKKLAGVYSKMEPGSAAQSLKHMEGERVALILSQMEARSLAAILNEAVASSTDGSEHVAEWSDAMRRLSESKDGA
jgi:flagellar motility protein MotE (MotC chaperone)